MDKGFEAKALMKINFYRDLNMNILKSIYGKILFFPCIIIYCFYVCFSGLADITKISYQYLTNEINRF